MMEVDERANLGHQNSGAQNWGDNNTGDQNHGNHNFGNRNYGDHNFGNHNVGHYNSTDRALGCFNTKPNVEYSVFNKPSDVRLALYELPIFLRTVKLTTCSGHLRENSYKEAIQKAWDEATEDERGAVLDLPNWNNEIFEEITGIDVETELKIRPKLQPNLNKED